jgi:hypothetical protein
LRRSWRCRAWRRWRRRRRGPSRAGTGPCARVGDGDAEAADVGVGGVPGGAGAAGAEQIRDVQRPHHRGHHLRWNARQSGYAVAMACGRAARVECDYWSRIWDSARMGRISMKFAHFGKAREEYKPAKKIRPNLNFWPNTRSKPAQTYLPELYKLEPHPKNPNHSVSFSPWVSSRRPPVAKLMPKRSTHPAPSSRPLLRFSHCSTLFLLSPMVRRYSALN